MEQPNSPNCLSVVNIGVSSSANCGVRDYSRQLGDELRSRGTMVFDVWAEDGPTRRDPSLAGWMSMVQRAALASRADVLLLHYSVYSYAWKGVPVPVVQLALRLHRMAVPVVTVLHEYAYPWRRRGLRGFVHAVTQRAVLPAVVGISSAIVVTTRDRNEWLDRRPWLPGRATTVIPVFSTIPAVRAAVSSGGSLDIAVFGYAAAGIYVDETVEGVARAAQAIAGLRILLVGAPGHVGPGAERWVAAGRRTGCAMEFTGVLPPQELGAVLGGAFAAVFTDRAGPTSRKTTLAALLAQGCPILAYEGEQSWPQLVEAGAVKMVPPHPVALANEIVTLKHDSTAREALAKRAQNFYNAHMDVGRAGAAMIGVLCEARGVERVDGGPADRREVFGPADSPDN